MEKPLEILKYQFKKWIDDISQDSRDIIPKRWDEWAIFSEEMPLIWHGIDGKIYEIYSERMGKWPYPPKKWTRRIQLGDIYPSKHFNGGKLCLHPTLIVADPISLEKGKNLSVFAFMTSNHRNKSIIKELLVENKDENGKIKKFDKDKKESYIKPFNLWGGDALSWPGGNLIKKLYPPLKCNCLINKKMSY
jgi:hypothetical protein